MLGITKSQLDDLPYTELLGWSEYFSRRPPGWRADNRAAIIALSMGGGKGVKPKDLFQSLKIIDEQANESEMNEKNQSKNIGSNFMDAMASRMTNQDAVRQLMGDGQPPGEQA